MAKWRDQIRFDCLFVGSFENETKKRSFYTCHTRVWHEETNYSDHNGSKFW